MGSRLRDDDDRRRPFPWWIGGLIVLAVAATWAQSPASAPAPAAPPSPDVEAVLIDVSGSSNPANRCGVVRWVAARAIERSAPVELQLWATGEAANGRHAELVEAVTLETAGIGESAVARQAERRRLAQRLVDACEALDERRESPVVAAVQDILHGLAARCRTGPACRMHVRTDGLDNHDPVLRRRLRGETSALRAHLDNTGVDVTLCDLTSVVVPPGGHAPSLPELDAAWRPLFTAPDRVAFLPACPRA